MNKPEKKKTTAKRKSVPAVITTEAKIIVPLFKVLVDGKSCHGGDAEWPPVGEWTVRIEPICCFKGWHLTTDPLRWWTPRATLWLCEAEMPISGDGSDKASFRSVRRIMEITHAWPYLSMFPRVRCFIAASMRSHDANMDISAFTLNGANLAGANLAGANLNGANLNGAYLNSANLNGANLSGAYRPEGGINRYEVINNRLQKPR
jgi:hypothetical protein